MDRPGAGGRARARPPPASSGRPARPRGLSAGVPRCPRAHPAPCLADGWTPERARPCGRCAQAAGGGGGKSPAPCVSARRPGCTRSRAPVRSPVVCTLGARARFEERVCKTGPHGAGCTRLGDGPAGTPAGVCAQPRHRRGEGTSWLVGVVAAWFIPAGTRLDRVSGRTLSDMLQGVVCWQLCGRDSQSEWRSPDPLPVPEQDPGSGFLLGRR